jgi:hypothetical protein
MINNIGSDVQNEQQEDQMNENSSRKKIKVSSSSKKKADRQGPDVLPGTEALVVTDRCFCLIRME